MNKKSRLAALFLAAFAGFAVLLTATEVLAIKSKWMWPDSGYCSDGRLVKDVNNDCRSNSVRKQGKKRDRKQGKKEGKKHRQKQDNH